SINQWSQVTFASYAPFRGRAVVVGDTIYAVHALMVEHIIAFSFKMDKGEHGCITYSLSPLFTLRGLEIACPPVPFCELKTGRKTHDQDHTSTIHPVNIKGRDWFFLEFCFTPECGDHEPIEGDIMTSMNQPKQEEITLNEHEPTKDENVLMWEVARSEFLARRVKERGQERSQAGVTAM
ncbi:hypothetical protein Prudu_337S000500, partial [Prunus dulcis]